MRDVWLPRRRAGVPSWEVDARIVRLHLLPAFGRRRLDGISARQVRAWLKGRERAGASPASRNRWLMALRTVFNLAVEKGVIASAPTAGIRAETIAPKALDMPDMARFADLRACLKARAQNADARAAALLLIMLTGAESGEILQARWENLSQDKNFLFVKTAQKNMMRRVCLPPEAAEALRGLAESRAAQGQTSASPWLFPSQNPARPLSSLFRYWDRLRKEYGFGQLRVRDLGRVYAAFCAERGESLQYLRHVRGEQVFRALRRASLVRVDESMAEALPEPAGDHPAKQAGKKAANLAGSAHVPPVA